MYGVSYTGNRFYKILSFQPSGFLDSGGLSSSIKRLGESEYEYHRDSIMLCVRAK